MRPATDATIDYKRLVQLSYDRCAAAYHESRMSAAGDELRPLLDTLTDGARVLAKKR